MSTYTEGYVDGFRNGTADRKVLPKPLIVALTSSRPGYAAGYGDGYNGRSNQAQKKPPAPSLTGRRMLPSWM